MKLELALLGRPEIILDGEPLDSLRSDKARAILYYLAATGASQTRAHLAEMFWPSDLQKRSRTSPLTAISAEERARSNLRHEVKLLNDLLKPFLITERDHLGVNWESDLELDIAQFSNQIPTHGLPTVNQLQQALRIYRGSFLDQFSVRDAPEFDYWVTQQGAYFEGRVFQALRSLCRHYFDIDRIDLSLEYLDHWLNLTPSLEEPHHCRMILLALNGEPARAAAHYERFNTLLGDDEDAAHLYQAVLNGQITPTILDGYLPLPPAPLLSLNEAPQISVFQAPPQLDYFVGRVREIEEIKAHIQSSQQAAVYAIVGMGGVGKSSLATRIAHELRFILQDGVLWADLARSEPMSILEGWGVAYGAAHLARCRDIGTRSAAFRDLMADKRVLIVLDDVERLDQVEPLRPSGNGCVVLITTKDREIASSLHAQSIPLRGLRRSDSLQLLSSVVGRSRVEAEIEAAETIARLLENLPLAIEIAAQQMNANPDRSIGEMAHDLQQVRSKVARLKTRNRAVRTSFERSWELLDDHLRDVFAAMAVFGARPFSLAAAAHVAGLDEDDDAVTDLWRLSLLIRIGQRRYRLHSLLADFAREKLQDPITPYQRMADYYEQFATRHRESLTDLDAEWSNIVAGMRIAYESQRWSLLVAYVKALDDAWFSLGRFSDARLAYGWLCEMELTTDEPGLLERARLFCRLGLLCIEQGDYQEAEAHINDGLDIYEELTHLKGIGDAKYLLGRVVIERERFDEAEPLLRESQRIREQIGDRVGVADALYLLADIPYAERRYDEARQIAEQVLAYYRSGGHAVGQIKGLGLMADIALSEGAFTVAEKYCHEALAICDAIHEQAERALILYILADAHKNQGKHDAALELIEQSINLLRSMGDRKLWAKALWRKATICVAMTHYDLAWRVCQECLQVARTLGEDAYGYWQEWCEQLYQKYGILPESR